ncbi:LacI family transcriptional regulator [Amycolatopsis mediterranei S699]|uniref:LacI family transcriptional regulator n=2 Tax=Amycolatopsis mediterranei TaxID=33910 RepID=A0A0H3DA53_AMYMU|nr:LacI family DNA-binding transcriptional regulator [Amycolatopsis mediterranei]ADJ47526.1 LacI family transcriptional regulator [Amycolatopsis mediterranei U32]AEK44385.1 LacI family transcriptional regulator [Amycolatopsis mediterranei S699]AFO79237.1 LacI family transcriptional regulator [Amycolatopsis mediterranei S699]AGT86365.1 LacI family transcriptional regulator [Amycolatopsis mediterranei RB]KDO12545.1 LacI family transcriptional regulator [Amycolatopsis mediterranei]
MKEVAAAAGVSVGTVSNVLNRPDLVSSQTRARVQTAIAELRFVRNETARHLRVGHSRVLAYVMLDGRNPFFTDVASGAEDAVDETGLSLFLCNSANLPAREAAHLGRLEQQRVQGILITPVDPASPQLDEIARRGTPLVVVDRTRNSGSHCSVAVDDVVGGEIAVRHLLEQGHDRIAFIGGTLGVGQVRDRREGALRALRTAGLSRDRLVDLTTSQMAVADGGNAGRRLAGLPAAHRPTAAFCANDLLALGLLQACAALHIRVPDDLAIVGYDDIEFAAAATVPLTSVRQPRRQLGHTAAELLMQETGDTAHEHQQVTFTPELVVRASTAPR